MLKNASTDKVIILALNWAIKIQGKEQKYKYNFTLGPQEELTDFTVNLRSYEQS